MFFCSFTSMYIHTTLRCLQRESRCLVALFSSTDKVMCRLHNWLIARWLDQDGLKRFLVQRSTCTLSASRYNCQPPMLHIKTPSPCLRNFSSLTRQQSITIFSSTHTLSITVFSSWKLVQFLLLSSPSHCSPSGVPLRLSYVLRSMSMVCLSPSLCPWSCRLFALPLNTPIRSRSFSWAEWYVFVLSI